MAVLSNGGTRILLERIRDALDSIELHDLEDVSMVETDNCRHCEYQAVWPEDIERIKDLVHDMLTDVV